MANSGTFPTPYINTVPEGGDKIMETVPFPTTDIGSRPSGLPKSVTSSDMNLKHTEDLNGK